MGAFGDPFSHSLELINSCMLNCTLDRRRSISLSVDLATLYCKTDYKKVLRMALYINLIMFCVCLILGKSTFTALHANTEA